MPSGPGAPALDPMTLEPRLGSSYPERFKASTETRLKRKLGDALGLDNFGVNLVHLPPGAASALRHWHSHEDEFIYVLEGEITLITDAGARTLGPGMAAGFPAGRTDGHHLVNRSGETAAYLEVGDRSSDDAVVYPDDDLLLVNEGGERRFTNRAGEPY